MSKAKPEDNLSRQGCPPPLWSRDGVSPCQDHLSKAQRQGSLGDKGSKVVHASGHSAVAFSAAWGGCRLF